MASAERLLESTVITDATLAEIAGWNPPISAQRALAELGAALVREATRDHASECAA
jgi:hypothetical protein